jgi:hypothetical protein
VVAIGFVIMGIAVISQANSTNMTGGSGPLLPVSNWLNEVFTELLNWTAPIPDPVLGLGLLALAAVFIVVSLRDRQRHKTPHTEPAHTAEPADSCHHDNAH